VMPPSDKSVFGRLSVRGRILEPTPADNMTALVLLIF
jgi:hypothetical protein